jgi:hypothetical protein
VINEKLKAEIEHAADNGRSLRLSTEQARELLAALDPALGLCPTPELAKADNSERVRSRALAVVAHVLRMRFEKLPGSFPCATANHAITGPDWELDADVQKMAAKLLQKEIAAAGWGAVKVKAKSGLFGSQPRFVIERVGA